jgi:hypothetical protein
MRDKAMEEIYYVIIKNKTFGELMTDKMLKYAKTYGQNNNNHES